MSRFEKPEYFNRFSGVFFLLFFSSSFILFLLVYVIAREGVKFGINFTSCSKNGNEISRGIAECYFAVIVTTSGIYPKISLLPVLTQLIL